jgi:uncharacterized membrane protein
MYCPYCGRLVPDDAKFCPYCGYSLKPSLQRDSAPATKNNLNKPTKILSAGRIGGVFAVVSLLVPMYLATFTFSFNTGIINLGNFHVSEAVWFLFSYVSYAQQTQFVVYYSVLDAFGFVLIVLGALLMLINKSYSGKIGGALGLIGTISASLSMIYGANTVQYVIPTIQVLTISNYQYFPIGIIFAFIGGALGLLSMPKSEQTTNL